MSSTGPAGDHCGFTMGLFELLVGEENNKYPVYKQVHSRQMPMQDHPILLFR